MRKQIRVHRGGTTKTTDPFKIERNAGGIASRMAVALASGDRGVSRIYHDSGLCVTVMQLAKYTEAAGPAHMAAHQLLDDTYLRIWDQID